MNGKAKIIVNLLDSDEDEDILSIRPNFSRYDNMLIQLGEDPQKINANTKREVRLIKKIYNKIYVEKDPKFASLRDKPLGYITKKIDQLRGKYSGDKPAINRENREEKYADISDQERDEEDHHRRIQKELKEQEEKELKDMGKKKNMSDTELGDELKNILGGGGKKKDLKEGYKHSRHSHHPQHHHHSHGRHHHAERDIKKDSVKNTGKSGNSGESEKSEDKYELDRIAEKDGDNNEKSGKSRESHESHESRENVKDAKYEKKSRESRESRENEKDINSPKEAATQKGQEKDKKSGDSLDTPPKKEDKKRHDEHQHHSHHDDKKYRENRENKEDNSDPDLSDDDEDDEYSRKAKNIRKEELKKHSGKQARNEMERLSNIRDYYESKYEKIHAAYPDMQLPEINSFTNERELRRGYQKVMRKIHLDESMDRFQGMLELGFTIIESIGTNLFHIDIEGYAEKQIKSIKSYNSLIIELNERSYSAFGKGLPVELKLLGFMLFNAVLFFIHKRMNPSSGDEDDEDGEDGDNANIPKVDTLKNQILPPKGQTGKGGGTVMGSSLPMRRGPSWLNRNSVSPSSMTPNRTE